MATIKHLLNEKGGKVWSVSSSSTVYEALEVLADKNIGALVVLEGEKLMGIFSERDYARKVALEEKCSKDTPVKDLMTSDIVVIKPDETIDACMELMTQKKIRHLPVMDEGKLVGIVTIGDVVKEIISSQKSTIDNLEKYMYSG